MQQEKIDTHSLLARTDIVDVINRYVPLKKNGAEYEACCPFHTEKSPSFKVSQSKQFYHCFGCGAHGDAIKFVQDYQGLNFIDACKALGADLPAPKEQAVTRRPEREKEKTEWMPIIPAPAHAGDAPKAHIKRGFPEMVWAYRDAEGRLIGYVYRFKTSDGGKEVLPLVWAMHPSGVEEWRWLSFPIPRPLYGLDDLATRLDATVLLVEGEKCRDAAAAELPDLVVVSWPGGGKAIGKVDWSPLYGRKVITWADCDAKREPLKDDEIIGLMDEATVQEVIRLTGKGGPAAFKQWKADNKDWVEAEQQKKPLLPEADQPGVKTMAKVSHDLLAHGSRVWSVQIPKPLEKPDGWDVADAINEGLRGNDLANWIREKAVALAPAGQGVEDADEPSKVSDWRGMLVRKAGRADLTPCRDNAYLFLKHHGTLAGKIAIDEFKNTIVTTEPLPWQKEPGEWSDVDDLRLGFWLTQSADMQIGSAGTLREAAIMAAHERHIHPVRDWLDGLKWDRNPRLHTWLHDCIGTPDTPYAAAVGIYFLIMMVARIYRPGCKVDTVLVLEGTQGARKSTALKVLTGADYFADTPFVMGDKDSFMALRGHWLYEIAELDSLNRAEVTRAKAFLSSATDTYRAPYGRSYEDHPRQCVFAATTNQYEYLRDLTGNRRFWPVIVGKIDVGLIERLREQLFAEAVHLFSEGHRWWPEEEEFNELFLPEIDKRLLDDPWVYAINNWLNDPLISVKLPYDNQGVSVLEILTGAIKMDVHKIGPGQLEAKRVGAIMSMLGFVRVKRGSKNSRQNVYVRPADSSVKVEQEDDLPL